MTEIPQYFKDILDELADEQYHVITVCECIANCYFNQKRSYLGHIADDKCREKYEEMEEMIQEMWVQL